MADGEAGSWPWYSRRAHGDWDLDRKDGWGERGNQNCSQASRMNAVCNSDIQGSKMSGTRGRFGRGSAVEAGVSPEFRSGQISSVVLRRRESGLDAGTRRRLGLRRNISQDTDLVVDTGDAGTWCADTVAG